MIRRENVANVVDRRLMLPDSRDFLDICSVLPIGGSWYQLVNPPQGMTYCPSCIERHNGPSRLKCFLVALMVGAQGDGPVAPA
jgi:hypothetical protein